jgi:hypothetical protein
MKLHRDLLHTLPAATTVSDQTRQALDDLQDNLDRAQAKLYDRCQLFANIYLTPVQARRWFLFFRLGTIKAVAASEKVSTTAVSKSLIGNSPNEKSTTRMRSPIEKMAGIVQADPEIQAQLAAIREIRNMINNLMEPQ